MKRNLLSLIFAISSVAAFAQQTPPTPKADPDSQLKSVSLIDTSNQKNQSGQDTTQIFTSVEQEPEFPGGPAAFKRYLEINLRYPAKAVEDRKQGKVFVAFVVEKNGSLSDINIIRNVSPEIDTEAVRVIKNSPRWKPAIQNGVPVRVHYTLPISFLLPAPAPDPSSPDSLKIFSSVEQQPTFPGGEVKFAAFLKANLRYPPIARENGVHGKVFLNFIIERDGSLTDIKVVRGIGSDCDEEAIRVLRSSPRWVPGMQGGHTVRVYYTIPIIFKP